MVPADHIEDHEQVTMVSLGEKVKEFVVFLLGHDDEPVPDPRMVGPAVAGRSSLQVPETRKRKYHESLLEAEEPPIRLSPTARLVQDLRFSLDLTKKQALTIVIKLFVDVAETLKHDVSGIFAQMINTELRECKMPHRDRKVVMRELQLWASGEHHTALCISIYSYIYEYIYTTVHIYICIC